VLIDLEAVINAGQDLAACKRGTVSVAALPSIAAGMLPHAIRRFRDEHEGIDVQVHDVVADKVVQMVKSEEVEFGLGPRLTPDRDVTVEEFLTDRLCAFFPAGHALARGNLSVAKLVEYPLILTRRNSSVRVMVERSLAKERVTVQIAGETNYMSTAIGMVRAGLGVAILPASAADTASTTGVSFRPIRAPWQMRKIGIIRKAGSTLSPACEQFVAMLRRTAKEQPLSHFALAQGGSEKR
jgi:DNA-binding transcriptional LysR family regulator